MDMSLTVRPSSTMWRNNDLASNSISSTGLSFECKLLPSYPDASDVLDEWLPYEGGATSSHQPNSFFVPHVCGDLLGTQA